MTLHLKPAFVAIVALLFVAGTISLSSQQQGSGQETSSDSAQDSQLRGVFLSKDDQPAQSHRFVGRLALLLKTDDGTRRVRPDYAFHSGDRFRFEIAVNQPGWLYVMHADQSGQWQQLWPAKADSNKVQSDENYEIPPAPGVFVFDKETGGEFFYVVVRSDKAPPKVGGSSAHKEQPEPLAKTQVPPPKPARGEITNFLVRDPFGETTRGVVFDPGKDDVDPYLYFTAADSPRSAKIKFQLRHTD